MSRSRNLHDTRCRRVRPCPPALGVVCSSFHTGAGQDRARTVAPCVRTGGVIAATAELNGATVLHYDADYDLIAEITGQPVEWVAEKGSL
jgi:hypothetical protein